MNTLEELVLLSLHDHAEATVSQIHHRIQSAGASIPLTALYNALNRLEYRECVSSRRGEPEPRRGGRAAFYFIMMPVGAEELLEAERIRQDLRRG